MRSVNVRYLLYLLTFIRRALRKSHGATKLKLYSYMGKGKYLGYVKIFPLGASGGAQGLLM